MRHHNLTSTSELDHKVDEFIDMLEDTLPEVDFEHRDELIDIANLLKARLAKFVDKYGLN